jgi:hypothetical protein
MGHGPEYPGGTYDKKKTAFPNSRPDQHYGYSDHSDKYSAYTSPNSDANGSRTGYGDAQPGTSKYGGEHGHIWDYSPRPQSPPDGADYQSSDGYRTTSPSRYVGTVSNYPMTTSPHVGSICSGDRLFCKAKTYEPLAINTISFEPIPESPKHVTLKAIIPCTPCSERRLKRSDLSSAAANRFLKVACKSVMSFLPSGCKFNAIETGSIVITFSVDGVDSAFGFAMALTIQQSLQPLIGSIMVSFEAPPSVSPALVRY